VSINQLINSAVSKKVAALLTEQYLTDRGKRGSHGKFDKAMPRVRDVEPEAKDRQDGED
jgi:hypothetical protein